MTSSSDLRTPTAERRPAPRRLRRPGQFPLFVAVAVALGLLRPQLLDLLEDRPLLQTWATLFVSVFLQALPFLVLGVALSAAITAFVPASFFTRALPSRPALAVPVAGASGMVLPGCECASVPVAGSLMARGVAPAAALAFLLSAPAINPIVVVSTLVAFPGQPEVAGARFVASLLTAVVMGWLWVRFGRSHWLRLRTHETRAGDSRMNVFRTSAQHDFLHAGGFLVVGGAVAATLNVLIPQSVIETVAGQFLVAVLVLAVLAVVLAICSEADAFVAASLTEFSMTARLAFMVVGPAVDVKLVALQAGTFGSGFAVRFAPATFLVAVLSSLAMGWWLL